MCRVTVNLLFLLRCVVFVKAERTENHVNMRNWNRDGLLVIQTVASIPLPEYGKC